MTTILRYGVDSSITLDLSPGTLLAQYEVPRGEPITDPAAATAAALAEPLDFPPLGQAIVPGDQVAVPVEPGVPRADDVVAAVVHALLGAGVEPGDLTIVQAPSDANPIDLLGKLPPEMRQPITLVTHDPADRDQLAFLAASTDEDRAIYVNRAIVDADFVVPIGCLRPEPSSGDVGLCSGLFPAFADTKARRRFGQPHSTDEHSTDEQRAGLPEQEPPRRDAPGETEEIEEAIRLLGILFTVQIVPAVGEQMLHVLAGDPRAVRRRGRELCRAAWGCEVPARASLVVASIEGDQDQQTWKNLGRALEVALQAVEPDGAIAICTSLSSEPGIALQRIAGATDVDEAIRDICEHATDADDTNAADLWPAKQLLAALEHCRVYLLSELDEAIVEPLGIAPVGEPAELVRLATHHASCIVLANAHRAVTTPQEEVAHDE